MLRAALIQVNFNKYPATVQESRASGPWPVPGVPGRRDVHTQAVSESLWESGLRLLTEQVHDGVTEPNTYDVSQREASGWNGIAEEALWKQRPWVKIISVAPVNPVFGLFSGVC